MELRLEPSPPAKESPGNQHATLFTARSALLCLYILVVLAAGILLRNWTWRATAGIHFSEDIRNGLFWGEQTVKEGRRLTPGGRDTWPGFFKGWVSIYDYHNAPGQVYDLDYAPLRLLAMSLWAKNSGIPQRGRGMDPLEIAAPLLFLNTLCEIASATAVFLLVRTWLRRCAATSRHGWFRRRFPGSYIPLCSLAAATVAWLEPNMILDAHAWPQWDVWIMPLYLFAALAMLNNRWLVCGSLLAVGAMIKPQILIVAPFFVLVPLCAGQWRYALRVLAGFAATAGFIAIPWLVRGIIGWGCLFEAALVSAAICLVRKKVIMEGGAWAGIRNIKQSKTPFWCFLVVAAAIWLAGWFCGGDFTWLRAGFMQGDKTSNSLAERDVWFNLPAILASRGWKIEDAFTRIDIAGLRATVTLRAALRLAYLLALIACSFGAARHLRRRDPRFLIAIAMPWLLMFALLGQMHTRYLLWGAVASSLAFGVGVRPALIHFVFSAAGAAMILMRLNAVGNSPPLRAALAQLDPFKLHAPYMVLASIAVWCWFSVWRSRPPSPRGATLPHAQ